MGFPSSHLARPGFSLVPVFHTTVCQLQSERNLLIRIKINNIMFSSLCLLASLASVQSYVLVPLYHPVSYIYPPPHLGHLGYLGQPASPLVHSPYIQISAPLQTQDISYSTVEKGLKFSPKRKTPLEEEEEVEDLQYTAGPKGRIAGRNLDLCYFLGNDIFTSHVPCNPNWGDGTNEGVKQYINELTFETNRMLGENNMRLTWKGPYERHDAASALSPSNPTQDVLSVADYGCDAVVFLVFNQFSSDCETRTYGHDFGGLSSGGMCEQRQGKGYTVVVDQGFLEDAWTGPQILAHHLLLMLTSDLGDASKTCPNIDSLLHPKLYPGEQRVDQCVVDKLNRSQVSNRDCMRN